MESEPLTPAVLHPGGDLSQRLLHHVSFEFASAPVAVHNRLSFAARIVAGVSDESERARVLVLVAAALDADVAVWLLQCGYLEASDAQMVAAGTLDGLRVSVLGGA